MLYISSLMDMNTKPNYDTFTEKNFSELEFGSVQLYAI